jgi:hypothetical protein
MYGDFYVGPMKSASGYRFLMFYADRSGWIKTYPLVARKDVHTTVPRLYRDFGYPATMITECTQEFRFGHFPKTVQKSGSILHRVEPHWQRLNYADGRIQRLKQKTKSM